MSQPPPTILGTCVYIKGKQHRKTKVIDQNRNLFVTNATISGDATVAGDLTVTGALIRGSDRSPLDDAEARRTEAYQQRVDAAQNQYSVDLPEHPTNDDEDLYSDHYANYSKGLPHNSLGIVTPAAYSALLLAMETGYPSDFDLIPKGGDWANGKLHSPQAGLAFELEGKDSHACTVPIPPAFASARRAAEAVELYWMAIMRDVSFEDYGTNANTDVRAGFTGGVTACAIADLNAVSDYPGTVTAANLFRGVQAGNVGGPYISQFLYLACPFGPTEIDQKMNTPIAATDFLITPTEWLSVQNGNTPAGSLTFDLTKRYIRNGRDLGQWVHMDVLYQAYFQAMLVLGSIGCPVNVGNPYKTSTNQLGFASFGGPHIAALLAEVCSRAIKATWYQKWQVHRTLRPEEYGGRVHHHKAGNAVYDLHADILNSDAIARVNTANGNWLLPMCFPEGAPFHPSYTAGHATVAAACVTVLKAWFDGSFVIPSPKKPNAAGTALVDYVGAPLTAEGELNKVAGNVGIGRHHAGVHWLSDYESSLTIGEQIAIEILRDQKPLYNENFAGFTFKKFDGTTITV
jgi:hypothetical protein